MKIKPSAIAIPSADPFANDILDRLQHAVTLTQFIKSVEEPITLSIEAGWGHGKSTFLKMWAQELSNQEFTCITFNAWEADFFEDPLIPFVSELRNSISKVCAMGGETNPDISELSNRIRSSSIQIAKRTLPVAAKILTAGLLDTDSFTEDAAATAIEKAIEEKFDTYEADKNNLNTFKETLSELVSKIQSQGKPIPLVFLIDELDRCKPSFALSLLERIKHIFNVNGIVFVLAIDRDQLCESIRTVYGPKTDTMRYLRRFIDYVFSLPDPQPKKYPEYLLQSMGFQDELVQRNGDTYANEQFLKTFITLSTCFDLRLRDQEHAFSILAVLWKVMHKREHVDPFTLATLLVVKVANSAMYNQLIKREINLEDFYKLIKSKPAGIEFLNSNYGWAFEATLDTQVGEQGHVSNKVNQLREAASSGQKPAITARWGVMSEFYESGGHKRRFDQLVSCIETTRQFIN